MENWPRGGMCNEQDRCTAVVYFANEDMIFLLILEIILLEWICKTCRRNGQEYGTGAREDNLSITHKFTQDLAVMVSLTDNLCVFVGYLFSGLCSLYLCNVCIEANASIFCSWRQSPCESVNIAYLGKCLYQNLHCISWDIVQQSHVCEYLSYAH